MTNQELTFIAFAILFFLLIYLIELIVTRFLLALLLRKSFWGFLFMFLLLLLLGAVYMPEFTQSFLSFMAKASFKTCKMIVAAIGEAINSS